VATDLITAAITAGATFLAGVVTFVAGGQVGLKLIDPCIDLKKFIGRIAADLDF
jgi:hypothetical protein